MLITWLQFRLICDSWGSNEFVYSVQTCFVDCLIEQTHPEIRKRDDVDVSVDFSNKHIFSVCYIEVLYLTAETNMTFDFFSSDTQTSSLQNRR